MNWNNFKNMINIDDINAVKSNPEVIYKMEDGIYDCKLKSIKTGITESGMPNIRFEFELNDNRKTRYIKTFYLFKKDNTFNQISTRIALQSVAQFVGNIHWNDLEELRKQIDAIEIDEDGIDAEIKLTTNIGSTFQNISIKNKTDKFAKLKDIVEKIEDDNFGSFDNNSEDDNLPF